MSAKQVFVKEEQIHLRVGFVEQVGGTAWDRI